MDKDLEQALKDLEQPFNPDGREPLLDPIIKRALADGFELTDQNRALLKEKLVRLEEEQARMDARLRALRRRHLPVSTDLKISDDLEIREASSGYLLSSAPNGQIHRIPPLTPGKLWTIGYDAKNDLVLKGGGIEYTQCGWTFKPGLGVILYDLSTESGTYVNGQLVGKAMLRIVHPLDTIALGSPDRNATHQFVYNQDTTSWPEGLVRTKYTRGKPIGGGTFGTVYKCQNRNTVVSYAIKVVDRKQFGHFESAEELLGREIAILKTLKTNHDHVVQLIEIFDEKPKIHIVMEYAFGGDFNTYLENRRSLSEKDAVHCLTQICKGVKFIHEQGITHRDLKPENILLMNTNPPTLKIADFGLAKLVERGTLLRTSCGTPNYMAPEVLRPPEAGYSNLVDSWSVGVMAFEMITARHLPFKWDPPEQRRVGNVWSSIHCMDLSALFQTYPSEQCIMLISDLLQMAPESRIDISQALAAPWLNPVIKVPPLTLKPEPTQIWDPQLFR